MKLFEFSIKSKFLLSLCSKEMHKKNSLVQKRKSKMQCPRIGGFCKKLRCKIDDIQPLSHCVACLPPLKCLGFENKQDKLTYMSKHIS